MGRVEGWSEEAWGKMKKQVKVFDNLKIKNKTFPSVLTEVV